MNPCIPAEWDGFTVEYQHHLATYVIEVKNPEHVERGVKSVEVNGQQVADGVVHLVQDGERHIVTVTMGAA